MRHKKNNLCIFKDLVEKSDISMRYITHVHWETAHQQRLKGKFTSRKYNSNKQDARF